MLLIAVSISDNITRLFVIFLLVSNASCILKPFLKFNNIDCINLEKSIAEMERFGYRHLFTYGGGEIKEGLFDTIEKLGVYIELVEYPNDDISSAEFVR